MMDDAGAYALPVAPWDLVRLTDARRAKNTRAAIIDIVKKVYDHGSRPAGGARHHLSPSASQNCIA